MCILFCQRFRLCCSSVVVYFLYICTVICCFICTVYIYAVPKDIVNYFGTLSSQISLCLLRPSRCVPASFVGAELLLEEPHRSGIHAGPLLSAGGHGERWLWQSRRRRQPQHGRWRDSDVPASGRQREEAASHSLPLSAGSKALNRRGVFLLY